MERQTIQAKKVMIVAAEASSSLYAERLLQYWSVQGTAVEAFGIGNQAMENLGFERLGKAEEMAVMGIVEVISHWTIIKGAFERLVETAKTRKPDVVVLMDYPDFNLRLAKQLKKLGLTVVYYIAPQIWAWRKRRIFTIQKYIDHVIVLFPFEEKFYRENGVAVSFVGHPLLDEMEPHLFAPGYFKTQRSRLGIPESDLVVGLMPGSRHGELEHHLQIEIDTASQIHLRNPSTSFILLVAPTLDIDFVKAKLPKYDFPLKVIKNDPFEMIGLVDVMIAASGTATLMVGLMHVPMVVIYRFKPLTVWLAQFFMKLPKYFCIVNLAFDEGIVTELFQDEANPDRLTKEVEKFIREPGGAAARASMRASLSGLDVRLGSRGATKRVAALLENLWLK